MESFAPNRPTPAQGEGPYYKAGSPEKPSLLEDAPTGTRLVVTGRVLDDGGEPISGAKLDFWQADEKGAYDNHGYRYRGHQFTPPDGSYQLETVVPRLYTGRTRHIHVKVSAPGMRELTTQLYFPNEAANSADRIFDDRLLLRDVTASEGGLRGSYDFVLMRA